MVMAIMSPTTPQKLVSLWKLASHRPWSISGGELQGDIVSRSVYLDESGIDLNSDVAVVVAVIVDTDQQWKPVEKYLHALIEEFVPVELQNGFVFHAKDLYHGWTKTRHEKQKQRFERGPELLRKVVEVPGKFMLPMTFGWVRKPEARKYSTVYSLDGSTKKHLRKDFVPWCHSWAYVRAVLAVESYMRKTPDAQGHLAKLIAEDNPITKTAIEDAHRLLMGQKLDEDHADEFMSMSWSLQGGLPLDRIYGSVAFEKKTDTVLLQLADACAYVLHRFYEAKPHNQEFVEALTKGGSHTLQIHGAGKGGAGGNGFIHFVSPFRIVQKQAM
jgi:hypothetical protein